MNILYRFSKYIIIASIIPSVYYSFNPGKIIGATVLIIYPIIIYLPKIYNLIHKNHLIEIGKVGRNVINLFIFSNILMLLHGLINLKNFYDYIDLFSNQLIYVFIFPMAIYFGLNNESISGFLKNYIKFTFPITFLMLINQSDEIGVVSFPYMVYPLILLLLISPYINLRRLFFLLIALLIIGIYYIERRSVFINYMVPMLIVSTFYYRGKITLFLMKILRMFFLIFPIVMLIIVINVPDYNPFKIIENTDLISNVEIGNSNRVASVDSRTSIYLDVFQEIEKKSAYLFGFGFNGKVTTNLEQIEQFAEAYSEGRNATESGMLNFIQWGGIFAAFTYYLLIWVASYYALNKSKNWFYIMIGLWLSFKLLFSFVDDSLSFNPSTLIYFMTIGLCFNKTLRNMNDDELKIQINKLIN